MFIWAILESLAGTIPRGTNNAHATAAAQVRRSADLYGRVPDLLARAGGQQDQHGVLPHQGRLRGWRAARRLRYRLCQGLLPGADSI